MALAQWFALWCLHVLICSKQRKIWQNVVLNIVLVPIHFAYIAIIVLSIIPD